MLTHVFRDATHADGRKVVDGEPGIPRVVFGEQACERICQERVLQTLHQLFHAHCFGNVLKQNLDKDTRRRSGFFLVEMDCLKHMPAQSIRGEHVAKQAGYVPQAVCFVSVYGLVVVDE